MKKELEAGRFDDKIVVFVHELGSMNNSRLIYDFINQNLSEVSTFYLDLSACTGVDSTFMGTLLLIREESEKSNYEFVVANYTDLIASKFKELGVDAFLKMENQVEFPEMTLDGIPKSDESKEKKMDLVLEAHEELCKKEEKNQKKFGPFIKALKESFKSKKS